MGQLRKLGFEVNAQEDGIQRRLQLLKVNKITSYLESSDEAFFPNSIILAANLSEDEMEGCITETHENCGFIEFPDSIEFQIVDGQHRLAGLFRSKKMDLSKFALPVILMFDVSLSTRAKIFADVNGNQTPVNKSNIYDLYGSMESSNSIKVKRELHFMCKALNEEKESPLFKHVKMLGIGKGAVSQSFLVNAFERALKDLGFDYRGMPAMYDSIFFYLKSFQRVFQEQWAVLENAESASLFNSHSDHVIRDLKSQALKTNGLGAIMRAFPKVYRTVRGQDYESYYEIVNRMRGFDWCDDNLRRGTGYKSQEMICSLLLEKMHIKDEDCDMLVQVRIYEKSVYPNLAFQAIEKKGINLIKKLNEYNCLYSAEYTEQIRSILIYDCALKEREQFWLTSVKG